MTGITLFDNFINDKLHSCSSILLGNDRVKEQATQVAKWTQLGCVVGMGGAALMGLVSLVSIAAHPILASLGLSIAAVSGVGFKDLHTISKNFQDVVENKDGMINAIFGQFRQTWNAISSDAFCEKLLTDTLVLGPYFEDSIKTSYKNAYRHTFRT